MTFQSFKFINSISQKFASREALCFFVMLICSHKAFALPEFWTTRNRVVSPYVEATTTWMSSATLDMSSLQTELNSEKCRLDRVELTGEAENRSLPGGDVLQRMTSVKITLSSIHWPQPKVIDLTSKYTEKTGRLRKEQIYDEARLLVLERDVSPSAFYIFHIMAPGSVKRDQQKQEMVFLYRRTSNGYVLEYVESFLPGQIFACGKKPTDLYLGVEELGYFNEDGIAYVKLYAPL